jgi:hypothetical protein
VLVVSRARHQGKLTCHLAIAIESTTHGGAHIYVASEEVGVDIYT